MQMQGGSSLALGLVIPVRTRPHDVDPGWHSLAPSHSY